MSKNISNDMLKKILFVAIMTILSYIITADMPELFTNAQEVYTCFYDLSLAYIASYIFYFLTIVIPAKRELEKNIKIAKGLISNCVSNLTSVKSFMKTIEYLLSNDKYFESEYKDMARIGDSIEAVLTMNSFINDMSDARERILMDIDKIQEFNNFFLKSQSLLNIINNIKKNNLIFGDVRIQEFTNEEDYRTKEIKMLLEWRNAQYRTFISTIEQLKSSEYYAEC